LVIPQFNVDARISFLVDTGADSSLIAPADAKEMGIDIARLGSPVRSLGVGGTALSHRARGTLVFIERRFVHVYHLDALDIASPDPQMEEMPSLLGREILDRWRMIYDPSRNNLSFIVRSADLVLDV
jgi:hypothetical protein